MGVPLEKEPVPEWIAPRTLDDAPHGSAKTARSGRRRKAVLVRLGVVPRTILTQ